MKINKLIISVIIASVILSIQFIEVGYAQTTTINLPTIIGDLNNDRKVDIIDLGILLSSWGRIDRPPADINQDGRVDVIDLGILLSNWGRGTTTTTSTTIPTTTTTTKPTTTTTKPTTTTTKLTTTTTRPTTTTITSLKCKEVITGFNNKEENRSNLVFMGINFPDIDSLKNSLDIYVNSDDKLYGQLFYYEPFKSNKDKFNLWYVDEIGFVENYSEGATHWGREADPEIDRLSKYCNVQNKQEVALINWIFIPNALPGKVRLPHVGSPRDGALFVHEFGHSFGFLGDEGIPGTITSVPPYYENHWAENCDIVTDEIACPRWCSGPLIPVEVMENVVCTGSSQISCIRIGPPCIWIRYEDPIYGQTGCVNRIKFCKNITDIYQCNSANNSYWQKGVCIWLRSDYPAYSYFKSNCIPTHSGDFNIGTNCLEDTGCYQTCGPSNWFKSSRRSMMLTGGFPFGTINERALCRRIQNTTGSVGGICTTKFGLS